MTATRLFVLVAVSWVAIGLITSYVMGRRGYGVFSWGVLGAIFGPLTLVLVADRLRRVPEVEPRVLATGAAGAGPVNVLVGIDGSVESAAALETVVRLLGPRIGRLTLATVVDFDVALEGRPPTAEREVAAELERLAAAVAEEPETEILAGPPAEALTERARDGGYHLLAIGSRGRGASKAVLGSVASLLARGCGIPVLVVGGDGVPEVPGVTEGG